MKTINGLLRIDKMHIKVYVFSVFLWAFEGPSFSRHADQGVCLFLFLSFAS